MHENNFEKQFREKMDQLEFDPSDAVWAGVDKEINKEKRRRLPVFWLFLFSGILLLGGGYYFAVVKNAPVTGANSKQQAKADKDLETRSESKDETKEKGTKINPRSLQEIILSKNSSAALLRNPAQESGVHKSDNGTARANDGQKSRSKINQHDSTNEKGDFIAAEANSQKASGNERNNDYGSNMDSSVAKKTMGIVAAKGADKDSVAGKKTTENDNQKKESHALKIWISGNAGISNMDQDLFHSTHLNAPAYASVGAPAANPNPGTTNMASKISPGFSFSIGGFVNKHLSERISLSAGLNYHYYSTQIHTGHFVDSSSMVYYSIAQLSSVNAYYRNGDNRTYTNQYHFIELPVTMNFQINKNKRLPVIWEGGISLSYLIYSNALQFDPYSNVYYKNDQLFNRTQFNAITAFMFGLPVHHASLQIGPQLQYGLTGVLKSNTGISEHLFYYGLKVSFLMGKNK